MQEIFRKFARRISDQAGSSWAFLLAVAVIVGWMAVGPWSRFSDTWQLVINTATTIITFLMVFLIQNTQNRDAKVTQLKLDELLRAVKEARNGLVGLEDHPDEELARVKAQFASLKEEDGVGHPAGSLAVVEPASSRTKERRPASSKSPPSEQGQTGVAGQRSAK